MILYCHRGWFQKREPFLVPKNGYQKAKTIRTFLGFLLHFLGGKNNAQTGSILSPLQREGEQTKSSWNWCSSFAAFATSHGKGRILLNLDESYLSFYCGGHRGKLVSQSAAQRHVEPPPSDNTCRKELRLGLTYVGLVGPNRIIQRKLLQVMIIGAKDCSKRDFRAIQNGLAANHYILRQPSKWITVNLMIFVFRSIAVCLASQMQTHEIVLLMDCLSLQIQFEGWEPLSGASPPDGQIGRRGPLEATGLQVDVFKRQF